MELKELQHVYGVSKVVLHWYHCTRNLLFLLDRAFWIFDREDEKTQGHYQVPGSTINWRTKPTKTPINQHPEVMTVRLQPKLHCITTTTTATFQHAPAF